MPGQAGFESRGAVLVTGPAVLAMPAGAQLAATLRVLVCATGAVTRTALDANPAVMGGRIASVSGSLGRFTARAFGKQDLVDMGVFSPNTDGCFDLVLDLNTPPLMKAEMKPAGYRAPGADPVAVAAAIAELAVLADPKATPAASRGAPAGEVEVDRAACTLCMACAHVCATGALAGDGTRLSHAAGTCTQCGICERACPERAISLRTASDPAIPAEPRLLHEAARHCCPDCGKPFVASALLQRSLQRFPGALMLCPECRRRRVLAPAGAACSC